MKKIYILLLFSIGFSFSAFSAAETDTQIGYIPASHPDGCVALQLRNLDSTGTHTWTFSPPVVNASTGPPAVTTIVTSGGSEPLIYWTGVGDKQICYDGDCEWFNSCNCNPFPADDFSDAPLICNSNLYCGTTSSAYGADMVSTVDPVHTGSIENNSWLQFVAASSNVTFTIDVAGTCEMQFAVYELGTNTAGDPSFTIFTDLAWTSTTGFSGFNTINATGLTPGVQYYIHLDGDGGAECDYEISFISGIQTLNVSGPGASVCPGDPTVLTVTPSDPTATYIWTDNQGGGPYSDNFAITVTPLVDTDYTVIVTGGACSLTDTLIIPVTMLTGCILPIELLKFEAKLINDKNNVQLDWLTSSEINNDYFTIERSINTINWEGISNIDGAGSSSDIINYLSIDNTPIKGISYYRLKQTDFNGESTYSSIRTIKINPDFENVIIHPNPIKGLGYLSFYSNQETITTIVIYDISGRIVSNKQYEAIKGFNDFKIETDNLTQGMYFVSFNHGKKDNLKIKFIKD